jgi:hypothetical protein
MAWPSLFLRSEKEQATDIAEQSRVPGHNDNAVTESWQIC